MKRPFKVKPQSKNRRFRSVNYGYKTNAFVEARQIAQDSMMPVDVFENGELLATIQPKDALTVLLERKRRLEAELAGVEREIARIRQRAAEATK